jgi:hypothetical protein
MLPFASTICRWHPARESREGVEATSFTCTAAVGVVGVSAGGTELGTAESSAIVTDRDGDEQAVGPAVVSDTETSSSTGPQLPDVILVNWMCVLGLFGSAVKVNLFCSNAWLFPCPDLGVKV